MSRPNVLDKLAPWAAIVTTAILIFFLVLTFLTHEQREQRAEFRDNIERDVQDIADQLSNEIERNAERERMNAKARERTHHKLLQAVTCLLLIAPEDRSHENVKACDQFDIKNKDKPRHDAKPSPPPMTTPAPSAPSNTSPDPASPDNEPKPNNDPKPEPKPKPEPRPTPKGDGVCVLGVCLP